MRFEVVDVPASVGGGDALLLEEQTESHDVPGLEASLGTVTVLAWEDHGNRFDRLRWRLSDHADAVAINPGWNTNDLLVTTRYGCCGSEDLLRYFDMKTGRAIAHATTPAAFADVANERQRRLLTYISDNATIGTTFWRTHPAAFGLLTLSDGVRIIDQVVLSGEGDERPAWSPKLELTRTARHGGGVNQTLGRAPGKQLRDLSPSPFNVRLRYDGDGGQLIDIPILNNRFDVQNEHGPKAITLRHAPVGLVLPAD